MDTDLQWYKKETLDWCNERRLEKGKFPLKRLPKGKRYDPVSCPCGKATGLSVNRYRWFTPGNMTKPNYLPDEVREFVGFFDEGYYPELEIQEGR